MLAFLFSFLWLLGPYIFIVYIGDYITRSITVFNMQSGNEESTYDSESSTVKTSNPSKKKRKRTKFTKKTNKDTEDQHSINTTVNIDNKYIKCLENLVNYKNLTDYLSSTKEHNSNVAKIFNVNCGMSKYFVVNESVFLDSEPSELTMVSDDECQEYRLYKVMKMKSGTDVHQNDNELTDEDLTETLFVTEEMTNSGVIINNNVFLNCEQWHTIQRPNEINYSCKVCQIEGDKMDVHSHITSRGHVRNLDKHRPLKRFDLSITRKIDDSLHCGVCNEMFSVNEYREHENTKSHEGYLLFAINKVSDIMWMEGDRKDTQIIENNNIQPPNNAPYMRSPQDVITLPDRDEWLETRTESTRNCDVDIKVARKSSFNRIFPRDRSIDSDTNSSPDRTYRSGKISDLDRNIDVSRYSNTDTRSEGSFNFGKNIYEDIKIYEEDEVEEYNLPIEGVSYASMASKPRLDLPKFYKIDLGTKEVRVKFESWNMITQTNVNEFYCMGCTESFLVRFKNTHCLSDKHRRVLAMCTVVGAFEDYLIRDVSEKLYHCGHCNNLQYKNDMQIHVEKYHPVKTPKIINDKPLLKPIEPKPTETNIAKVKLDIFGDFTFNLFGAEITVSNLGCHTLMLVDNKYLCALCNVYVKGNLIDHVYEATHMRLINMAPFIKPFQCNLTRAVRGSLHCALCNILIPVTGINDHNVDPSHTDALACALGMVKNERPKEDVKYHFEEPSEFKTDLERFLSTLPPSTRGALSKLKIKNHKGEIFQLSDTNSSSSSSTGTPSLISLNKSPEHTKNTLKEPVEKVVSNPQEGVSAKHPDMGYPIEGAVGIKQDVDPKNGVETSPNLVAGYFRSKVISNIVQSFPKGVESMNPNVLHPIGEERIIPPRYPVGGQGIIVNNPPRYPFTGVKSNIPYTNNLGQPYIPQMLTVSMIESGLTRAQTGSPTNNILPGPMDLKKVNESISFKDHFWDPLPPHHRPDDIQVANQMMVFQKQAVQAKVDEPVKRLSESGPEKKEAEKGKDKGKVQEKTATVETKKPEAKKKKKTHGCEKEVLSPFILDEIVLLKFKSSYFEVTSTSYHTLVHLGNGMRHCFVCSSLLDYSGLKAHVCSTRHIEKMDQNKFLYNFCGQLFRQMYRTYHCTICNVTMSKSEVKMHLEWSIHINKYNLSCKKLNKKVLKDVFKPGVLEFNVQTQKECLYENVPEPIDIITYIQSSNKDFQETYVEKKVEKKSQMIILKGNVMKLSFESWHGVLISKSGVKCIICQQELTEKGLLRHLSTAPHTIALGTSFEKSYYPALIRKINKNTVNCVICNLELPNEDSLVMEHISGRKHYKKYNANIENACHGDPYRDCNKHPITL